MKIKVITLKSNYITKDQIELLKLLYKKNEYKIIIKGARL